MRGNGHLAVTEHAIAFAMMVPRRTLLIPRDRVTGVGEAKGHLGKWVGRPVVKVSFLREDGTPDSVAFDVGRDRKGWLEALGGG